LNNISLSEKKNDRLQTNDTHIDIGAHFYLKCSSSSEVLWLRHSPKSDVHVTPTNQTDIIITNFTVFNAGNYYCYGTAEKKMTKFLALTRVIVKGKLHIQYYTVNNLCSRYPAKVFRHNYLLFQIFYLLF